MSITVNLHAPHNTNYGMKKVCSLIAAIIGLQSFDRDEHDAFGRIDFERQKERTKKLYGGLWKYLNRGYAECGWVLDAMVAANVMTAETVDQDDKRINLTIHFQNKQGKGLKLFATISKESGDVGAAHSQG